MSYEGMHSAPVPQLIMRDKEKPEKVKIVDHRNAKMKTTTKTN